MKRCWYSLLRQKGRLMGKIRVFVHLEAVNTAPGTAGFSWWAESPDVPGYSVAADHLYDVLQLAEDGLPGFLDQEQVDIEWRLVPNDSSSEGDALPTEHLGFVATSIESLVRITAAA
jgi:hypothetical protein